MEELSSKKLIIIVLLLLVIAFGSGILIGKNYFAKGSEEIVETERIVEENIAPVNKTIRVYVAGEVKKPDVYELDDDAIVKDAVMLAGGFTENADTISYKSC